MKKAIIGLVIAIAILCLAFFGYLLFQRLEHERLLRNYPTAYVEEIRIAAEEFSLDPYFVMAIMRCESSFDPEAVSNRGAIGLMQIMPDTGEWIAHKLDLDDVYKEKHLYEPATNVRFGCWYLQFLSNRFDGDRKKMIAAYNAGHGAVEKWLEDPKYSEGGALTTIPYESTALYYTRVEAAYENYLALYPELFAQGDQTATREGGCRDGRLVIN